MTSPVDTCDDSYFDYQSTKMVYTERVNIFIKSKIPTWNRERETKIINRIIRTQQPELLLTMLTIPPENLDENTKADLAKENGIHILTLANSNIQIVPFEDCFDIFVDLHLRESHAGFDVMYPILQKYFYFPRAIFLKYFLLSCNVCIEHSRTSVRSSIIQNTTTPSIITDNNLNLVVHLMFLCMSFVHPKLKDEFKYLLVYRQEKSGYVLLRPLLELDAEEVALELYNIFADFGPPETIKTTKHLNFLNDVLQLLQMTPIKYNCEVNECQFDHESLTNKIAEYMNECMNKCNSSNWAAASYIVQFCLNTDGDKPMEKLFGPRDGSSSKICLSREKTDIVLSSASTSEGHSSINDPSTDPLLTKEDVLNEDTVSLPGADDNVSDCDSIRSLDSENHKSTEGVEGSVKEGKMICHVCQRAIIFKVYICTKCTKLIHVFCGLRVAADPKSFSDCQLVCKNCAKSLSELTE